jgi:hypothetical protein
MASESGRSTWLVLSAVAALACASPLAAQDTAAAPAATPAPKVDVTGFVDVYYGYNFNETAPALRTFDVQHNAFSLSLAEIAFAKGVTPESRVGFRVDLDFGKAADLTTAFEPGEGDRGIYQNIEQAYLSLLTGKVQWDVGKFVTPIGAEVIESQDNWNYTRSILFGYAIPFYHLGVRATATVNDKLSLAGFVTNGWNNASEMHGGAPCVALQATVKPSSKLTWYANYMVGQEAPDPADARHLFDTTLSLTATEKLSLMANFDYGKEGEASWWGLAAYAKLQANPSWALVGRYEYVDDTDGGFMTIADKAQSVTLTSDHLLAGGLRARLEYRLDLTDGDFFTKSDGSQTSSQSTVTVGLVYGFSGKI